MSLPRFGQGNSPRNKWLELPPLQETKLRG